MDYDFEAFAQKIVANKNTVSNANKQAADTMTSVGIGNIGGSTTTTSAQQVQNNFFRNRDRDRNRGGSTYDEVPQTLTQGLGAPTKPPVGQEEEDEGGISSFMNNIASWFNMSGASDPKPQPPVSGASVYDRDEFKPFSYDPTTDTSKISGIPTGVDMRSSDEIMADIDAMLDRSDDTSYKNVYESTYDEVPQSLKGVDDFKARKAMTEGINNTIKGIMEREGKDYKDMKDTINNTIKGIMDSGKEVTKEDVIASLVKDMGGVSELGSSFEGEGVETAGLLDFLFGKKEEPQFEMTLDEVKEYAKNNFDPVQAAAFVATFDAETGGGRAMIEDPYTKKGAIAKFVKGTSPIMKKRKEALEKAKDSEDIFNIVYGDAYRTPAYQLGNDQPGDGNKYRGRGPIMLTGKKNYKKYGDLAGYDLVSDPDLMRTDKQVAIAVTKAYLDDKGFSNVSSSEELATLVGHADPKTEGDRRWKKTKKLYKEMYGEELPESLRPRIRPKGLGEN